jgi:hypothetical protein
LITSIILKLKREFFPDEIKLTRKVHAIYHPEINEENFFLDGINFARLVNNIYYPEMKKENFFRDELNLLERCMPFIILK